MQSKMISECFKICTSNFCSHMYTLVEVRMMLFLSLSPHRKYLKLAFCGLCCLRSNLTGAHWSEYITRHYYIGDGIARRSECFSRRNAGTWVMRGVTWLAFRDQGCFEAVDF
jgi:hypothetical protein